MTTSAKPLISIYDTKPYDREYLKAAAGVEALHLRFRDFRLEPETTSSAEGAAAVCVFVNDDLQRSTLEQLARLGVRMVALRCAGFNNVDLKAAKHFNIAVTRVASYSPHAVAEHTVALILTLNRKIHRSFVRVRELNFSLNGLVGFDLHGKTAGIVGTGKIGRIVCEILQGFGMRVVVSDPFPNLEWAARRGIEYLDNVSLARQSDIISLHAPFTPQTDHIVNGEFIAFMKPGAMLVNVSRGRLVHTLALIEGLKSGQIGGVALDVYEEEEGVFFEDLSGQVLQDDELARLLTFPNVLITAHQAFLTREALSEISHVTVENLLRFVNGQPFLEGTQL
ncbi:MAG TPA: 2-hydroxyacid dehydrogenase [Candidatus Methylacidiphilales bacterium]|jgi:D-lactate dehydrogenase|nr:2-hydroxyacid dehydrogenase [Candidatus Methylacidiphilales bacterium]